MITYPPLTYSPSFLYDTPKNSQIIYYHCEKINQTILDLRMSGGKIPDKIHYTFPDGLDLSIIRYIAGLYEQKGWKLYCGSNNLIFYPKGEIKNGPIS